MLAVRLKKQGLKGIGETNLKLSRQFYQLYPQIGQALSYELKGADFQLFKIGHSTSDQLKNMVSELSPNSKYNKRFPSNK